MWMVMATIFTKHECLQLFLLGLLQRFYVLYQLTHCSGVATEIEVISEEITGETLDNTADNLVIQLQ